MKIYINKIALFAVMIILLFTSCANEELMVEKEAVKEGEPTVLRMSFKAPEMDKLTRSDLGLTKEQEIYSLAVFIFDSNGYVVSQTIHETAGAHSSSGTGVLRPNGTDFIPIETQVGLSRDIYVVVNFHSNLIEGFRSISSVADMKELIVTMLGNPIFREFGLCKVAQLTKTDVLSGSTLNMNLQYLSAKITINVVNKCPDLSITGWTADELPMKSFALERTYNSSDPTYHDAVKVQNSEDFYNDFSDQNFPFEISSGEGFGSSTDPKSYSNTFYMYENRRGTRVKKSLPTGWTTPNPETDFRLKSWFAPERASRIRVWGRTAIDGDPKSFVLNHYLGANNYNDYNVNRATHYTYNITINGLNDIHIDTNVEQTDLALEVRQPSDLMNIDAHVSTRPFIVYSNDILDPSVSISVEVLESMSSTFHPDWLDLTTVSLKQMHVRASTSTESQIALWQQAGEYNTYVRPKFIPNKKMRDALGGSYTSPVPLGTEEYPDDDQSLPYDKSYHRMSKRLTDIPTAGRVPELTEPLAVFLHIHEFPYTNTVSYREAVVRFTVSRPGQESVYFGYSIRQYPPYAFTVAPDGSNSVLVVERIEEYEHATHSYIKMNLQMTAGMQWGNYDLPDASNVYNGFDNTLLGVYNDLISEYYGADNSLSPKYGSLSGGWRTANLGIINEGAGVNIPTIGSPQNKIPHSDYDNAYNLNYNMTAARYCHEKNADINGDGNIDPDETFWYLPSPAEAQLYWTYREAVKMKSDFYWTSVQRDDKNAYAVSMLHESSAPHLTYNGVPISLRKQYISVIGPPRVRCLRRVATTDIVPIRPMVSQRNDGRVVVDCSNLPNTMYTTISKNNIVQGNNGAVHAANRLVYKRLEVQSTANAASNYNSIHFENGLCDKSLGWRLPTQREMLLIFSAKEQLEAIAGFASFNQEMYWTMTRDLKAHYTVNFKTGLSEYGSYFDSSYQYRYRCVRELP